jgi:phage shock protein PspC (stress-responsive transcriptional regulator)
MQQVIHASLHGLAFTFETAGYEALRAYLDRAAAQLSADPDREEILGDLEQAIADKCARLLAPHKSVVTADEMARVLAEMGPVGTPAEVGPDAPPAPPPTASAVPPGAAPVRRLYRVLEGGKLGGLCNGLGAFFGLDANVVRVAFVVLTLVTSGAWLLVYLVLLFVVPVAGSPEERAAARGLPFSAQGLIDDAKRHYATLERELQGPWAKWKSSWTAGAWRDRRDRPAPGSAAAAAGPGATPPASYARQVVTALLVPVIAFWGSALLVAEAVCAALLIANGRILGWSPGLPLWGSLLVLVLLGGVLRRPLDSAGAALRRSPARAALPWLPAWEAAFWIGFVALFCTLAWHLSADLREVAYDLPGAWERVRDSWQASR